MSGYTVATLAEVEQTVVAVKDEAGQGGSEGQ